MREYHAWQKRQLRILELGILVHPYVPLKHSSIAAVRLREIIRGADDKPIEMGKDSETMQELHNLVVESVCRSNDGTSSKFFHWVDAFPLNLHLYLMLLGSCFDRTQQTTVIEEIDGVMDVIKKTWGVLGFNQMLHNISFTWILFQQFVATGQIELDFLGAVESQLAEVGKDAKEAKDPLYMRVLNSTLDSILEWAEKKLLFYHDTFHTNGPEFMQNVLGLALATVKILVEDVHQENKEKLDISRNRIDIYIRSSLQSAFAKKVGQVDARNTLFKGQGMPNPDLLIMARDTWELARKEKDTFSPVLKLWHPFPLGIAAVTLHSCYGRDLKRFLSGVTTLTPEAIQVFLSAENLEKELVRIAVEDSVDCEDGGKAVMQEMSPYEANSTIAYLTKIWIKERLDRLQECVNGSKKQEVWSPKSAQEQYASSAVEVLAIIKDSLDAFFKFSIPNQLDSLLYLVSGLERSLQCYISNAKSGCGSKNSYLLSFPSLTRCKKETKCFGLWKRKKKSPVFQKSKSSRGSKCLKTPIFRRSKSLGGSVSCLQSTKGATFGLAQLFVRMNTLYHIQSELNSLDQVISHGPKNHIPNETSLSDSTPKAALSLLEINFNHARADIEDGIQKLCECAAYKVVFHDLRCVLIEGLYNGGVSTSRIGPVLIKLELNLQIIKNSVKDKMWDCIIDALTKTTFEGFLSVLLAGGPTRVYSKHDSQMIEEDLKSLKDLFITSGVPSEMVENAATSTSKILLLFSSNTEDIIKKLKAALFEATGRSSTTSRLPLPPTSGVWSLTDPNTILRVLCYRNDYLASHFLKKTYRLPKKI
ncbi:protein unc-13 homolog [Cryptomeria japonica]|uniref:protein unc-13 homolog n=1 Tax=Cryptomeria japonica TaxID=3369 RepID=UPI0027DAB3C5|nr:protein unc-13 homolog [Cryptomeria japonica]